MLARVPGSFASDRCAASRLAVPDGSYSTIGSILECGTPAAVDEVGTNGCVVATMTLLAQVL